MGCASSWKVTTITAQAKGGFSSGSRNWRRGLRSDPEERQKRVDDEQKDIFFTIEELSLDCDVDLYRRNPLNLNVPKSFTTQVLAVCAMVGRKPSELLLDHQVRFHKPHGFVCCALRTALGGISRNHCRMNFSL
jgi:hypothetical protein